MLKKAGILTAALCLTVLLAACGGIEPLTSYEKGMAAYQSGDLNKGTNMCKSPQSESIHRHAFKVRCGAQGG